MSALPSQEEFAALVAAYPGIPDWTRHLAVSADEAAAMIGIQAGSIRIPRDAPGGRWLLATLVQWRASLPGRGHNAGRPPADTTELVASLPFTTEKNGDRLTVKRMSELIGHSPRVARRVYIELYGEEPVRGRAPAR